MFIGHFGVGFGAKAAAPRVSLGTLLFAAQFVDLLWPTLLLLGLEQVRIAPGITAATPLDFTHYPISHSLLAVLAWAVFVGGSYWLLRGNRTGAAVVAALVVSHWVLDLVVHRPDLPLLPGNSLRVGFGLWNSVPATIAVELVLLAVGVWLYVNTTRSRDRTGTLALWLLVALLVVIGVGNVMGPPPPSVRAIAWAGELQWLLVAMGWWIDRHRDAKEHESFESRLRNRLRA